MSINLDGVVYGARAVLPGMTERGQRRHHRHGVDGRARPDQLRPDLRPHQARRGRLRPLARAPLRTTPRTPPTSASARSAPVSPTPTSSVTRPASSSARSASIMPTEHVAGVVMRSLDERVQGAQWAVWPGSSPRVPVEPPFDSRSIVLDDAMTVADLSSADLPSTSGCGIRSTPTFRADPYPYYDRLRTEAPAYRRALTRSC